jgi:hypothetical protein
VLPVAFGAADIRGLSRDPDFWVTMWRKLLDAELWRTIWRAFSAPEVAIPLILLLLIALYVGGLVMQMACTHTAAMAVLGTLRPSPCFVVPRKAMSVSCLSVPHSARSVSDARIAITGIQIIEPLGALTR